MPETKETAVQLLIMYRKILRSFVPLALFLSVGLGLGCNDEPTSVGLGLISTQDLVRIDTSTTITSTATPVRKNLNTGSSRNLMVGKYLGYEALTLMKFGAIPDTLRNVNVVSADLVLRPSYRFGDFQQVLSFTVHKMNQGWTENGVTWDSLSVGTYESTVRGTFEAVVADTDSVIVPIDPNLIRSWFDVSGLEPIQGIILVPKATSGTIVGFHGFPSSSAAQLVIDYLKNDTRLRIVLFAIQDAYIANVENLQMDPTLLYVQAGVSYRTVLKFDFPGIPKHAGIHRATLELTLKRSTSRLNEQSVDSLLSLYLVKTDSVLGQSASLGHRLDPNSDVYTFTVTPDVQRWINGETNLGFRIEALDDVSTLDLFTFFSANAEPSVRPRLRIWYSRLL